MWYETSRIVRNGETTMYDIEGALERQLAQVATDRPTVMFTEALDPRVLEAVCYLARHCRPVLLAPEKEVRYLAARELTHVDPNRLEFALSESTFVRVKDRTDLVSEFAHVCQERKDSRHLCPDLDAAKARMLDPAMFGLFAVKLGHADIVVSGASHAPRDYFRPMLKLFSTRRDVCEAGVFVLPDLHPADMFPHNIVVFGDTGVNATMTPEVLAEVAVGTCSVARDLFPEDVLPTIQGALVSYSNRGSDEGPSPEMVRRAMELVPAVLARRITRGERYRSIRIAGEVKINAALSRRSAAYYFQGEGEEAPPPANVIICPNVDMGNLLYNLYAARFPTAKKFAVVTGVGSQAVDLALDTTAEDARLAVKATILRLHLHGGWKATPKDTFIPRHRILAINPGSTSTKIAVYENDREIFTRELQHGAEELQPFDGRKITAQFAFRKDAVIRALADNGISIADLHAVSGRGGLVHPTPHGTYVVDEPLLDDLRVGVLGDHASNLGGLIAAELVSGTDKPAFIVDPPVVDEVPSRVKVTGLKSVRRKVISHALNQVATARRYAEEHETFYEKVNVIVAHMGGGISIGAHHRGRYVDVNNALDGEGPFTPQRSGSLPVGQLLEMCFSGAYTKAELKALVKGRGGLIDLLGTADLREVEQRIAAGDDWAGEVFEALAYQVSKWITSMLPAFDGEPLDKVLLTGGMARSQALVARIEGYVRALGCGVRVYPGENEMAALAKGALRVLNGHEKARAYRPSGPAPV
jgi:butyrate kinase